MSTYDDASLVMIPSGYKTGTVFSQKPMSTDGQLTFTRSNDTATRVNSAGLIEKVRTNVCLYSEQADNAFWGKERLTITANATTNPIDGATTADKMVADSSSNTTHNLYSTAISVTSGITYVVSAYFKKSEYNYAVLGSSTTAEKAWFNLTTGVKGTAGGSVVAYDMVSVGDGWYRCWAAIITTSGSFIAEATIANVDGSRTINGVPSGGIFCFGFQLERGDVMTDYIATTTAAVSVGPVANVPRLDYLNSSCPRLLLEPTATALNNFSEQLDNAYWTKANCTVTANQTASPSGYVDAELVLDDTANNQHVITRSIAVTSGNKYTASFFLKAAGYTTAAIRMGAGSLWTGGTGPTVEFDLVALTGTVVEGSGVTFTIEDYGNGWRRCSVTGTCVTSGNTVLSLYLKQYAGYIGNGTDGIYAWGANITATGYLQSYIPTLAASVTRGADACSKTGVSSLIGQTQGTLFVEMKDLVWTASSLRLIGISDGSFSNRVVVLNGVTSDTLRVIVTAGGVSQASTTQAATFGNMKIALAYSSAGAVMYVNGTQLITTSAITVPATSAVYLGMEESGSLASQPNGTFTQALLFKTRLTNQELQDLTTL